MFLFVVSFSFFTLSLGQYYITTLAGNRYGFADGPGAEAMFRNPGGLFIDASGNLLVADSSNNMIRKINSTTGYVSSVAGSGSASYSDGQSVSASLSSPANLFADFLGNIFVADSGNNMIRKINASGYVSTLMSSGIPVAFSAPRGLAIDLIGNIIVSDGINTISSLNSIGFVSIIAGSGIFGFSDGQGADASFYSPSGLAIDAMGNIFVADYNNNRIRKINSTWYVSTFAGSGATTFSDGQGIEAALSGPSSIDFDSHGNLYVTDSNNQMIRKINSTGYVSSIYVTGLPGMPSYPGTNNLPFRPNGIALDSSGNIFVSDSYSKIRKLKFEPPPTTTVTILATTSNIYSHAINTATYSSFQTISTSVESSFASSNSNESKILKIYLKPEFIYSALIGMFFFESIVILIIIVTRKTKLKVSGRREKFIQNLEMQRKLELKQRQKSLPRNLVQWNTSQGKPKSIIKKFGSP